MCEKKLRHKIFFTLIVLIICSALTHVPVYGLNSEFLSELFANASILSFMDSMTGGSLSSLSMAGFGISSYITATIVIQLLSVAFPSIERVRRDGEHGRKAIERVEFILAMCLTVLSGTVLSISFGGNGLFKEFTPFYVALAIVSWFVGSFIVIFLAKQVEEKGIGNGITLVLGCNILARMPSSIANFCNSYVTGKNWNSVLILAGLIGGIAFVYLVAIYLQCGVLNVTIKQTRKSASIVNSDGVIPISVNISSVLPVIYASTILSIPTIILMFVEVDDDSIISKVASVFNSSNWYNPTEWYQVLGFVLYLVLLVTFSYFASMLAFSADEIADGMKKNGDVIPGVNPGADTVAFLHRRRKVMATINVVFLLVIATLPDFVCAKLNITSFNFLGTSLIIVISMLFDTAMRLRAASIHNDKKYAFFRKGGK
jgi:preprotein translocase subunit SecY